MPRLFGSDKNMTEIQVEGGPVIPQQKDGTFHVSERDAAFLKKHGAFGVAGVGIGTVTTVRGFRCRNCGFLAAFRDHCGRCGGTDLEAEA